MAGMAVKSGGEKAIKQLLSSTAYNKMNQPTVDLILFSYEIVTAMLARSLMLAVRNPSAVFVASVLTSVWELMLRLTFIGLYRRERAAADALLDAVEASLEEDPTLADMSVRELRHVVDTVTVRRPTPRVT